MTQIEAREFPFVESLPKREKSKWRRIWDHFQELKRVSEVKGMLVPVRLGAELLGISRQRVDELVADGRIEVVEVDGRRFATEVSIVEYARSERKAGRPTKAETITSREMWRLARKVSRK